MDIPFNQFEQFISETILARGLSYFKNGYVIEEEETSPGIHEAVVEGTDNYKVYLKLEKGIITDYNCSCPYDYGPVCKHIAAVLFHLQQDNLSIKKKEKRKIPKKRKTKADKVLELLEIVPHNELKQFVFEQTERNRIFRDFLLSSFAHHNKGESKKQYESLVNSIVKSASGRFGFIDWSAARIVSVQIETLLKTAQKQIENESFKSALLICTAVMGKMTEALNYSDDSNGDIGGCVNYSCELLYEIANKVNDEKVRKSVFSYCIESFENKTYSGWDWHIDMLQIASLVSKTSTDYDKLLELLNAKQDSEYEEEISQEIKYNILSKLKGESVANEYLEQNITNPILRRIAISNALNEKDYSKAKQIADEGIEYDKKDKPGLVKEWYDWLLKIAQATNDKQNIIKYARFLFIDNFRHEQDYYAILKKNIPVEQWDDYVNDIINELKKRSYWLSEQLINSIYIKEEWWDKLFEQIKENPNLNSISEYEKYLSKDYSNELSDLYVEAINQYLEDNVGRKYYKIACKFIRRIKKLGNNEKARELIEKLRKDYKKRPALLEELNKV